MNSTGPNLNIRQMFSPRNEQYRSKAEHPPDVQSRTEQAEYPPDVKPGANEIWVLHETMIQAALRTEGSRALATWLLPAGTVLSISMRVCEKTRGLTVATAACRRLTEE